MPFRSDSPSLWRNALRSCSCCRQGYLRSHAHRYLAHRWKRFARYRYPDGRISRRRRAALWHGELWRSARYNRAASLGRPADRWHSRPARSRDRHALGRPKAKGRHRRDHGAAASRTRARRAHCRSRPGKFVTRFRYARKNQPRTKRDRCGNRAEGGAAFHILQPCGRAR